VCLDQLGRYETAATIAGYTLNPITRVCYPRPTQRSLTSAMSSVTQTYESLARKGEMMTTAAMVTYAYDQIDQARAELKAVSK
jgi:hypothetical protein